MPKCLVCNERYADNLRRCPSCGASPDAVVSSGGPGTADDAALRGSSNAGGRPRQAARKRLIAMGGALALLAGAGLLLYPKVVGVAETGTVNPASQRSVKRSPPIDSRSGEDLSPHPPAEGFHVASVRILGGDVEIVGNCSPDGVARVLVEGRCATMSPRGDSFYIVLRGAGTQARIVAEGIDGTSAELVADLPERETSAAHAHIRVRGVVAGQSLPGPMLQMELVPDDGLGLPHNAEVELASLENRIPIGTRVLIVYRALPGLVVLRTTSQGVQTLLRLQDGQEMVLIPAGRWKRGRGDDPPQGPEHYIRTGPFLIDRTEVTCRQYAEFLAFMNRAKDSALRNPEDPGLSLVPKEWTGDKPPPGVLEMPVTGLTWYAAFAYARWVGGRLPTEAEWERAAGGPLSLAYPWGGSIDRERCRNAAAGPVPADSMPAGEGMFSLLHACGNVREWCADRFDPRWLARAARVNPIGPSVGNHRCVRGGSFRSGETELDLKFRDHADPSEGATDIGFRVVRDWVE